MTLDRPTVHRLRVASRYMKVDFEDEFAEVLRRAATVSADGPLFLDNAIQEATFDAAVLPALRAAWRRAIGGFALDQAWENGFQTGLPAPDGEDG